MQTAIKSKKILIVEDEPSISDYLSLFCKAEGYDVVVVANGLEALMKFGTEQPDFVLLDLMLPSLDGTEVCRRIRNISKVPIIMVTARIEEVDKLLGLETGADDYLTKPFSPRELMARIRVIMRRVENTFASPEPSPSVSSNHVVLRVGNLTIDRDTRQVRYEGKLVSSLTNKEYELLLILARVPERVFSKTELEESLYDCEALVASRAVSVHVSNLRNKLPNPSLVQTVYGIGYKLVHE